jgi:beta-lactamase class A
MVRAVEAEVALAAHDLETGETVDVKAGRIFHAASTMKVGILIEVFRQAAAGKRSLDDELLVHNEFESAASGTPFAVDADTDDDLHGRIGRAVSLRTLTERMIVVSSNLATNLLLEHIGTEAVQATLVRLGAGGMVVRRGVEDLDAFDAGIVNTTTPEALARMLLALAEGRAVAPAVDQEMIDLLRRQQFRDGLPARLPGGVTVAHKPGWTSTVQHDAGIVETADHAPYVIAVCTEGFDDSTRAEETIATLTQRVHAAWRDQRSL